MARDAMQVSCSSCGATVVFVPPTTATACDFCGGKIVAQPKAADPLVAPESVLPFSFTNQQAVSVIKKLDEFALVCAVKIKNSRRTRPRRKRLSAVLDFRRIRRDRVRRTARRRLSGNGKLLRKWRAKAANRNKNALVIARREMCRDSLTMFRFRQQNRFCRSIWKNYTGISANSFLMNRRICRDTKRRLIRFHSKKVSSVSNRSLNSVIQDDIRRDIGGDHQQISNMNTDYSNITFKHLLVPVYASAYKFNNKVYQVVINGRTGEVQGERPYSWVENRLSGFRDFVVF